MPEIIIPTVELPRKTFSPGSGPVDGGNSKQQYGKTKTTTKTTLPTVRVESAQMLLLLPPVGRLNHSAPAAVQHLLLLHTKVSQEAAAAPTN